jgi:hypothetical protein
MFIDHNSEIIKSIYFIVKYDSKNTIFILEKYLVMLKCPYPKQCDFDLILKSSDPLIRVNGICFR